MKKYLWPLLLLLVCFSGMAWADASNPQITSSAVSAKTDISIAYLSSVFGTVSGVLMGTSGQMLGKVIYQFNQGLLVVAGCWLAFTVLTMVFKSAITGSFMQQDNKVVMILLRIALGFGLLIPNPSTGYTVLQGIVMQVVVQSVKLADQIWEYSLDYLNAGGSLWTPPTQTASTNSNNNSQQLTMSYDDFSQVVGKQNSYPITIPDGYDSLGMVQKIMAMEACMVQSSIDAGNNTPDDNSDVSSPTAAFSIYEDLDNFKFEFPGGVSSSSDHRNVDCGQVYWNVVKKETVCTPGVNASDNSKCEFSHLALREVVYDLLPAVKKYVCLNPIGSGDKAAICSDVTTDTGTDTDYMTNAMLAALINYQNLINPLLLNDQVVDSSGNNAQMNFYTQARKEGWMMAGRYYWDIMRLQDKYTSLMNSNMHYGDYIPNADDNGNYGFIGFTGGATGGNAARMAGQLMTDTAKDGGYIAQVTQQASAIIGANQGYQINPASMKMGSKVMQTVASIFLPVLTDIPKIFMAFQPDRLGTDPIIWLHHLGMSCMSFGLNAWFGTVTSLALVFMIVGICKQRQPFPFFDTLSKVMDWIKPILMFMTGLFILVGFMLGFFIPLYLFLIFTFAVLGWLIAVIEAMVAAPLVAMGVTHPESHDFLGRSAQALMLLLGLFLRPSLILIGMLSGMVLVHVVYAFIIHAFAGFASDIFGSANAGATNDIISVAGTAAKNVFMSGEVTGFGRLMLPMIVAPLFLVVFSGMIYVATTNCLMLVTHLPDYIMSWIGGPQSHGANVGQMVEGVKGNVMGMSRQLGKGMSTLGAPKREKEGGQVQLGGGNQNGNQGPNPPII